MKFLVLFLAGMVAGSVHAQNWVVFVPAERDFRVLFPGPPVRSTEADGSIAFKAQVERNEYDVNYVVYRLPSGIRPIGDARSVIEQRLRARVDEERGLRYVNEQDDDPGWDRHVFRHGPRAISVHRLVEHRGRYYELQVAMPRGSPQLAIHTARDFFNSFQITGVTLPAFGVAAGQRLEAWCQNRTDGFSSAFCRYSVCLQSGYEKYPHCTALLGR